jgi:fatty-acyl-CoA synthase/long-chain acyl-CoA synthetase
VEEVAVIGVPDERWGEAVHAFVVPRPGQKVSPRELMLSLKGHLADFKAPTRYTFIDKIPRNPSGKILRRALREQFWRHMDRQVN